MSEPLPPAEPGATRYDRGEPIIFMRAISVRTIGRMTRDLLECSRCGALVCNTETGRSQHGSWHYGFDRVLAMIQDTIWTGGSS